MAIPLLIAGAIAAAAAAAGGIASAASQADAAATNASEQQKDRALKEKLQKQQLAEQERQFQIQQGDAAYGNLRGQLEQGAAKTTEMAAERAATRDDLRQNLSRAYLTRKNPRV